MNEEIVHSVDDLDETIASIFEHSINIDSDSDESCLGKRSTLCEIHSSTPRISSNNLSKPTTTSEDSVLFHPTIKSR